MQYVTKRPNLELKAQTKQLSDHHPIDIALPCMSLAILRALIFMGRLLV
jgi:hypothetical protein